MKCPTRTFAAMACSAWLAFLPASSLFATTFTPAEIDVVTEDRALLVKLEPGIRRAKLEVLDEETGKWEIFSMAHLAGDEGMIKIRVPDDVPLDRCRVQISDTDPFPYSFYQTSTAYSQEENQDNFRSGFGLGPEAGAGDGVAAPNDEQTVQESDLWQWRGDLLYFFNQRRGLQVFDMTNPEEPAHVDTLRLPATGDQMYILDDEHVLLLANYVNYTHYVHWEWDFAPWQIGGGNTEAILVKHTGDQLEIINRVPFNGHYSESRLVGKRLYLVTQTNGYVDNEGEYVYQNGLEVNQVDYSDPEHPVKGEPLTLSDAQGYYWSAVVTASPEYLLVVPSYWDSDASSTRSRVHVIPIGQGLPLEVSHEIELRSFLPDKFKLRVRDGILTTVSQRNNWQDDLTTYVESFDLTAEGDDLKCDELILAPREQLHATRFYGDRLYVVTFFVEIRKDPLFVIDLSDPKNLKSLGELEIPGWSNYLELIRDQQLLSIGVEDGNVAVSLFDVSNPNEPGLLSRVYPGEGQTWSEANWDEKAVTLDLDQNLLLLPLNTWRETEEGYQYKNLIQIIDVNDNELVVRGSIEHTEQGRRANALGDYIASISARELIVVDAEDRDHPTVVAKKEIAWDVARIVEADGYLLQIEDGTLNQDGYGARIRVTTKENADQVIGELELGPGSVVGQLVDGEWLYLTRSIYINEEVTVPGGATGETKDDASDGQDGEPDVEWKWVLKRGFSTDVIHLADPSNPVLAGTVTEFEETSNYVYHQMKGHLLPSGDLVWYPEFEESGYPHWRGGPVAIDAAVADIAVGPWWWGGWGNSSTNKVEIFKVDVSDKSNPSLKETKAIEWEAWREMSETFVDNHELYFTSEQYLWEESAYTRTYHLHRVSLTGELNVHDAVSVPGKLQGLYRPSDEATVLFTTAPELEEQEVGDSVFNRQTYWYATPNLRLQASIYDGQQAFKVTETIVTNGRFSVTETLGPTIIKPADEDEGLRTWVWAMADDGSSFEPSTDIPLDAVPHALTQHDGLLLAEGNYTVFVIAIDQLPDVPATLAHGMSGPISAQNLRRVDTSEDGECLLIATGAYGIESVDISGLRNEAPPEVAAQTEESWRIVRFSALPLIHASGDDFVGPVGVGENYRFRAYSDATDYDSWALAHFNPCGDTSITLPLAHEDSDGDGSVNLFEFAYATDPGDRQSRYTAELRILSDGADASYWAFPASDVLARNEVNLVIERSTDLLEWDPVAYEPAETGEGDNVLALPPVEPGIPAVFYRTRLELR